MIKLRTLGLTSGYDNNLILNDVSIEVNSGEIVGLIGSNGAGKTTLIKTILGIIPQKQGTIEIDGVKLDEGDIEVKGKIGYIPEIPLLYDELTLGEHMEFTAMANRVKEKDYYIRKEQLLNLFKMKEKVDHFPSSFSKGMKQKVLIMCSLLYDPPIMIVDEPFIGLDPKATIELLKLLEEKRQKGSAILMSTHVLDTAEKTCQRFIVLDKGTVIFKGTLDEMKHKASLPEGSLLELYDKLVGDCHD